MFRFGMIGTNFISDTFVEACRLSGVCEPWSLYSRKTETGEAFAARHGIDKSRVFTDLESLASSGIDAVYIASPNSLHCEQSLFFLERKIPVLCEKPAAPDEIDFSRMRSASEIGGTVLLEAMRQVHDPAWQTVREYIPRIGKIRGVSFEFCQYSSRYGKYLAGEHVNTFDPSFCNASMLDIGVYPITTIVDLFGKPDTVSCTSSFLDNGFEASGTVTMGYGDFVATATYSKVYDSARPSVISGEDGVILIDKISVPSRAELKMRGGKAEEIPLRSLVNGNNLTYELIDFIALVREGKVYHRYSNVTETTITVMDRARKCSGVKFK